MNSQRDVMTDGKLTALLRSVDPWALEFGVDDCTIENDVQALASAVLTDGATVIPIESSRALRRRRTRLALAAGAGAVALALTGAAVVGHAWSGVFAQGTPDGRVVIGGTVYENLDGTDTSEIVDARADDYLRVVAGLAPRQFALPAWVTWDNIVNHHLAQLAADPEPSSASANTIRSEFMSYVETAWEVDWVEATEAGDAARAATALRTWRAALDTDRAMWAPPGRADPHGVPAAAQLGDVATVRHDLELNGPTWLVSHIGLTYLYEDKLPLSNSEKP